MVARVAAVNGGYCHVINEEGARIFVHQSECDFEVQDTLPGDVVDIDHIDDTPRGPRGRQVRWVERPVVEAPTLNQIEGVVVHVDATRKYAFMRPDSAGIVGSNRTPFDIMIHVTGFADYDGMSETFETLSRRDRVRGVVRQTSRGQRMEGVVRV